MVKTGKRGVGSWRCMSSIGCSMAIRRASICTLSGRSEEQGASSGRAVTIVYPNSHAKRKHSRFPEFFSSVIEWCSRAMQMQRAPSSAPFPKCKEEASQKKRDHASIPEPRKQPLALANIQEAHNRPGARISTAGLVDSGQGPAGACRPGIHTDMCMYMGPRVDRVLHDS